LKISKIQSIVKICNCIQNLGPF